MPTAVYTYGLYTQQSIHTVFCTYSILQIQQSIQNSIYSREDRDNDERTRADRKRRREDRDREDRTKHR